ncbi:helix-turn-helix domain-containing protein [Methylobacterium nodulans]|uniref:helix-turn-helix domain-containing protein n=1 Tax=Methylobacterium nodulans TaxID=114616 RepID=UPI00016185A9|nr:helix-turn-helix domain-containing protein [Methylobacterium nodulans]
MAQATTIADAERRLVIETLIRCRGNRTHAAKLLGVSVRTIRNKISEYKKVGIYLPIYKDIVDAEKCTDAKLN